MARARSTSRCTATSCSSKLGDAGPDFDDYFGEVLARDRQPGRPLAGRAPAHRRRRAAQHHPLQLEDVPREHQRHGASAVGARVGHARGAARCGSGQPADAPKPMAMEQILPFGAGYDFFDRMGGRVYPERPQRARHELQHPLGLRAGCPSTRRRCARRTARRAPTEILQRSPQNAVLLPEPGGQGLAAGDPRDPPAGGRPHAGRGLELSRRGRARTVVRALDDLQPARVLADVGGGARRRAPVREHPARACAPRATSG